MTDEEQRTQFKIDCEAYFSSVSLEHLRSYGRFLQLRDPTRKKKAELIQEIIKVLCGELIPRRNNKGAPIKNDYVSPKILEDMERIKRKHFPDLAANEETENETEASHVSLRLSIDPSHLTEKQKLLLNDFLNSL